ncbi:MAG: radical SAM protein, partial [bacterium]
KQIAEDWQTIKKSMVKFLDSGYNNNESPEKIPADKTALEKLSEYAIKNWQLTNANLELTNLCNNRCKWCYTDDFKLYGLSKDHLINLADELLKENVLFLLFTGGEIFLRPDVMEIIEEFAKRKFIIELKTNGTMINDSIIERLSGMPLLDVQVSIYGINDGWSEEMQAVYPYNKIRGSIRKMINAGIPVTQSVLVGKHNVGNLANIHNRLLESGAKVFYSPYITPNRSGPGQEIEFRLTHYEMEEKFRPFLEEIDAMPPQKQYRDCSNDKTVCYAGRDQIAIGADGRIYPCLDLRLPMGNIKDEKLTEIISRRKKTMDQFNLSDIAKCNNCSLGNYCDSCVGVALIENGDYRQPSQHKCDIVHFYNSHERR